MPPLYWAEAWLGKRKRTAPAKTAGQNLTSQRRETDMAAPRKLRELPAFPRPIRVGKRWVVCGGVHVAKFAAKMQSLRQVNHK